MKLSKTTLILSTLISLSMLIHQMVLYNVGLCWEFIGSVIGTAIGLIFIWYVVLEIYSIIVVKLWRFVRSLRPKRS